MGKVRMSIKGKGSNRIVGKREVGKGSPNRGHNRRSGIGQGTVPATATEKNSAIFTPKTKEWLEMQGKELSEADIALISETVSNLCEVRRNLKETEEQIAESKDQLRSGVKWLYDRYALDAGTIGIKGVGRFTVSKQTRTKFHNDILTECLLAQGLDLDIIQDAIDAATETYEIEVVSVVATG